MKTKREIKLQSTDKVIGLLERISKYSIYLLVFLVPLFFLPWTANILDFNKQALLILLVFTALISQLIKILVSAKLEFNVNALNIPIVILFLVYIFSTLFSSASSGSFWGYPLNVSAGFLSLIGFFIFYFLVSNIFKKEEIVQFLLLLISSGFLAGLFGILQIFGKFLLPFDWAKVTSFNTIGTVNSLGVFLASLFPLTICLFLVTKKKLMRYFLALFGLIMLVNLVFINFWVAWVVLIESLALLIIFGLQSIQEWGFLTSEKGSPSDQPSALGALRNIKTTRIGSIILPIFLLIVALFFFTLRISLPGAPSIPIEISPSQGAEFNIAKKGLVKNPILGSGPGTFVYEHSRFKSKDLNLTLFWNIRFTSGASEILDKLITTGLFGILSLLAILGTFVFIGFKTLKPQLMSREPRKYWILLGIFSSFIGIILSQFLYPTNFSLTMLFWVMLGSFAALTFSKVKTWTLKPGSSLAIGFSLLLVSILIFGVGLWFITAQRYVAEMRYLKASKAWQIGESELAIYYLERAINLNPNLDKYWRDISHLYLVRLNETLQRKDLSEKELINQSQFFINNSLKSVQEAINVSPENVANWNVGGFIYRNLIGVVGGAEDWAIKYYQKASELEPVNPFIFTEIGRVYLARADILEQEDREEVIESLVLANDAFQKALELKSDYAPARFQRAMIDVREGKTKEAIEKLEETKLVAPFDTGLAFQLGVLYYQDEQFDKAKVEFERAVRLNENYSNARYFLGLVYDQEGKKSEAISQFEKIEELNPDNQEVQRILVNLRAGKAALEGITIVQPPIEEKPPEIEK